MFKDSIRQIADAYGIYLISVSNDPNAEIFDVSDEKYIISSTDSAAMKAFIREHSIDGVYMGCSEPVISVACQYIAELGLPCYCTKKQWEYLQNKRNFKSLCINHDLPVVPRYTVDEIKKDMDNILPVITKPADGCGSNGFSICTNQEELEHGVDFARENSPTNTEIIEKFVSNDAICVFYTFSDGIGHFVGSEDKYPVQYQNGGFVGGLYTFKSFEEDSFRKKYEEKILALFNDIGIKEGCIWIEIFRDRGKYYFNEIGYRIGGSLSVYPVAYMSGINQLATDIYYALTGESEIITEPSLINEGFYASKKYCVYTVHAKPGVVKAYKGEDLLRNHPNIVMVTRTKHINDIIPDSGTFAQVASLVHFVFDTIDECRNMVELIHNTLRIIDENGNNMLMRKINFDSINIVL